jgi:hypothetical protein
MEATMTMRIESTALTLSTDEARTAYEAPGLQVIGNASEVILGFPGGGLDGPYGLTDPQFEFELDGAEV